MNNAGLGDEGAAAIAGALSEGRLPKLKELRLNGTRMGDAGATALAGALGGAPQLKKLIVGKNAFGQGGKEALKAACAFADFGPTHELALAYMRWRREKAVAETPEIARFYETQAQLPSRGGPRAELDDRISKRCEESDEVRRRNATLLPLDNTTGTEKTCVSKSSYNHGHYMLR